MTVPPEEMGGDPACWAHLFDDGDPNAAPARPDLSGRESIEVLVKRPMADTAKLRAAKMAAALERLMDGVTAAGDVPISVTVTTPPRSPTT